MTHILTQISERRFVVIFTDGSATSIAARSMTQAKGLTQGSPDQFGTPRKVKSIREARIADSTEMAARP
jgi:hypothetical protein